MAYARVYGIWTKDCFGTQRAAGLNIDALMKPGSTQPTSHSSPDLINVSAESIYAYLVKKNGLFNYSGCLTFSVEQLHYDEILCWIGSWLYKLCQKYTII